VVEEGGERNAKCAWIVGVRRVVYNPDRCNEGR